MEPTESFNDKEKEMIKTLFNIIQAKGADEITADDTMYVVNNALPVVELLKKSIYGRLVSLGIESDEATWIINTLTQMSIIAGGVSLADFSITEQMAKENASKDLTE
jgi:hypothetical protein